MNSTDISRKPTSTWGGTHEEQVISVLNRETPGRFAYAPNYWQWFAHQHNHGLLPEEIKHCRTQLDVIKYLGLNVFSRNIYCDEQKCWYGGLADIVWKDISVETCEQWKNRDKIIRIKYNTRFGVLEERLRYDFEHSTLVQEKFLIDDYENQWDALEDLLSRRCWRFRPEKYCSIRKEAGEGAVVVAGELHSPLKMLHFLAGPVETTYMLSDDPKRVKQLLDIHETAQLELVKQMAEAGVKAMMSMDNLDTMFHPPAYVENYSASFYEKASQICHEKGSAFFIHACGRQKDNLALISSLGVDGLEGVAFPPLGDTELDEAMRLTGDRFIITGGISALEIRELKTREEIFKYVKDLFERMRPYANRFILSASCNTPIDTGWDTIKHFRDAWMEYGSV